MGDVLRGECSVRLGRAARAGRPCCPRRRLLDDELLPELAYDSAISRATGVGGRRGVRHEHVTGSPG